MKVLIVDDHPVLRRGLRALLQGTDWVEEVLEARDMASALREAVTSPVDVVVMDLTLPDGSGLDAIERLLRLRPGVRVLVLSLSREAHDVTRSLELGARGFMSKETEPDTVVEAIHAVAQGALVLGPDIRWPGTGSAVPGRPAVLEQLTTQERAVLTELADGLTNAQIGRRLGLHEKTVRNYLSSVFAKLQVTDRTQAALVAREHGMGSRGPGGG